MLSPKIAMTLVSACIQASCEYLSLFMVSVRARLWDTCELDWCQPHCTCDEPKCLALHSVADLQIVSGRGQPCSRTTFELRSDSALAHCLQYPLICSPSSIHQLFMDCHPVPPSSACDQSDDFQISKMRRLGKPQRVWDRSMYTQRKDKHTIVEKNTKWNQSKAAYLLKVLQVGEGLGSQQILVRHHVDLLMLSQQCHWRHGVVTILTCVSLPTAMKLHVSHEVRALATSVGAFLTAVLSEAWNLQKCIHLRNETRWVTVVAYIGNHWCSLIMYVYVGAHSHMLVSELVNFF